MSDPTVDRRDVKIVMAESRWQISDRRAKVSEAQIAVTNARLAFMDRATARTWARLVAAARTLRAVRKAADARRRPRAPHTEDE